MRVGDGYLRAPAVLPLELIMIGGCAVPRNRMHAVRRESSPLLPGIKPRPPSPVRRVVTILTELIRIQSIIKFKEIKQFVSV